MSSPRHGPGRAAALLLAVGTAITGVVVIPAPAYAAGAPTVTGLSVTKGSKEGDTNVLISGTNFTDDITGVAFGSADGTNVMWLSSTRISVTSPANSTDGAVVDVRVTTTSGGQSATSTSDQFTYRKPITATIAADTLLNPAGGGKLPVTINYAASSTEDLVTKKVTAKINGLAAIATYVRNPTDSSTLITLPIPVGTPSATAASVMVYHDGVAGVADDVNAKYAAVITKLSVVSGPTTGGGSLTVTGKGFTGTTGWKIGDTSLTGCGEPTSTSVTCTGIPALPDGADPGPYAVSFTPAETGGPFANTAAGVYTYTDLR